MASSPPPLAPYLFLGQASPASHLLVSALGCRRYLSVLQYELRCSPDGSSSCFLTQGAWAWERTGTSAGERHPLSLKLDLAGAAAEASQQGMSSDLWKGGADNQHAVHDQVMLMQDTSAVAIIGRLPVITPSYPGYFGEYWYGGQSCVVRL
jgi:hypothetical protein